MSWDNRTVRSVHATILEKLLACTGKSCKRKNTPKILIVDRGPFQDSNVWKITLCKVGVSWTLQLCMLLLLFCTCIYFFQIPKILTGGGDFDRKWKHVSFQNSVWLQTIRIFFSCHCTNLLPMKTFYDVKRRVLCKKLLSFFLSPLY